MNERKQVNQFFSRFARKKLLSTTCRAKQFLLLHNQKTIEQAFKTKVTNLLY